MLAPYLLAVVAVAIVVTSFISGLFGMAGGMILLGLLLLFMDVPPAMVLFGIIQLAANGWRSMLWWRHVAWSIVWRFLVGSTAMFLVMRTIAILPSKATIYIGLGLIP
ncbi:MAG TPA: sulfite exporter TauE/SafE family protein, partial [Hyphomicrobiaceae bacterium]|nr:sulfite exporter TauE/SafE family protein [Hyphomicrobiaceae bacterium]